MYFPLHIYIYIYMSIKKRFPWVNRTFTGYSIFLERKHIKHAIILTLEVWDPCKSSQRSVDACPFSCKRYTRFRKDAFDFSQQHRVMESRTMSPRLPCLLTNSHAQTHMQRHSRILSPTSAMSQQQVSEDRGNLCAGLATSPSSPPAPDSGHLLLEKDWPWRGSRQPASQHLHPNQWHKKVLNVAASALALQSSSLFLAPLSLFC